jgi:hypothetical protein
METLGPFETISAISCAAELPSGIGTFLGNGASVTDVGCCSRQGRFIHTIPGEWNQRRLVSLVNVGTFSTGQVRTFRLSLTGYSDAEITLDETYERSHVEYDTDCYTYGYYSRTFFSNLSTCTFGCWTTGMVAWWELRLVNGEYNVIFECLVDDTQETDPIPGWPVFIFQNITWQEI